ncbi:MAG: tetratricopeptide repeat protein, partial [Planctomycetota bacterium]
QALKVLDIEKDNEQMRLLVGWIELQRGTVESLEKAEWVFRRQIKDFGDAERAVLGLAQTLEGLGVFEERAASAILRGERLPDRGTPEKRAAEYRKRSRKSWEESYELFSSVQAKQGDSVKALDGLQRVTARLGRPEESLEWSQKLLEQAQRERDFYRTRLESVDPGAREEQRMREGERRTRQLMANTYLFENAQLVALGRLEAAVDSLDDALELDPDIVDAYSKRAQLQYLLEDYPAARRDIETFIARSPLPTDHPDVKRAFDLLDYATRQDASLDWVASIVADRGAGAGQ